MDFTVADARTVLDRLKSALNCAFLPDDYEAKRLPKWIASASQVTGGHLVEPARTNDAVLATLDAKIPAAHGAQPFAAVVGMEPGAYAPESTVIAPEDTLTEIGERFFLFRAAKRESRDSFATDVRAGLCAAQKRLPPKYFYDELGSALFEAICALPEYYLTRAETEILERYASEMIAAMDGPIELVEFGSGSARKTRLLLQAAIDRQNAVTYRPIDISPVALETSASGLLAEYPELTVKAYASDYVSLMDARHLAVDGRALALFLGSNIGNYEPEAARALLVRMRGAFAAGDGLLLGYDLKKDARTLELAYDDPTGVTAAFDRNLLGRINRELGGAFDLAAFRHSVRYDRARGSVDSSLVAQRSMRVSIAALGLDVPFAAFEPIHTESSYKFDENDVARLGKSASMRVQRTWHDDGNRFAVSLLVME